MARLRPPQYPVDETEIEYIPQDDGAWDKARVEAEMNRMNESAWGDHPWFRYFSGEDRYSLTAPSTFVLGPETKGGEPEKITATIGDYLDRSKDPEIWTLRRIDELDFTRRVLPHQRRDDDEEAQIEAIKRGLVRCTGGPDLDCNKSGKTSPSAKDVRTVIREGLLRELGTTIIALSRPLTDAEKKRFGC